MPRWPLAYRFQISREQMDAFALESHKRVAAAQDCKSFEEVVPVYSTQGHYMDADDGVRRETSMEKLASLKPFFDKKFGSVTAGNSSQVTDGAALLLLASEEAVKKYHLPILARIVDTQWAGVDPAEMGLGPVHSTVQLLQRQHLQMNEIDYCELNEAFAAQVLACQAAWDSAEYCQEHFGMSSAAGAFDSARLNVDGGAIALGHPIGASGARIVLRLIHILKRERAKRGLATICIGGGQGGTMLIENMEGVA